VAVQHGAEALTYAQLNARANQLARYLRGKGVGPEDRVALCLERSLDLIVGILAVLKAGGAYVPIDPTNPDERITLIMEDCGARLLVSDRTLEEDAADISLEGTDNLNVSGPPERLVYIIYTSGSTGRPKGTLIQHGDVQRLFTSTEHWFSFGSDDVWTLFHSFGFDFSVWEIWGALRYGGRLVVVPHLVSRSPGDFYELLARERVTVLNQTPSAFQQLIDAEERLTTPLPLALRLVICSGEALDLESLRPWLDRHGEVPRLVNMYGITETTVVSSYRPITRRDLETRAGSVIGEPIPDVRLYLLDESLELVPIGVPGELLVGGAGVARGYLDRPDLTAERFVPDPYGNGERLYRSGDLARRKPDGDLEYLGRLDHQVKIRGFRIELGEIESALASHEQVRDAIVLALEGEHPSARRLVAYVTPRADQRPRVSELRAHLQSRLPDYMVPAAFVVLDQLPLTANGKIDHRALPAPTTERQDDLVAFEAPRPGAERILADAWMEALGVARISRHDNFFTLGGDSIRSITVLARARARGVDVALQDLFQHQTIAAIIEATVPPCAQEAATDRLPPLALLDENARGAIAARGVAVEDAYPLTRLQEGMLFHSAFTSASTMYHIGLSVRLRLHLEEAPFRTAVARLGERHPVLRTSVHPTGFAQPLQIVHASVAPPVTLEDLRTWPEGRQSADIDVFLHYERQRRFEWTDPPLFRLSVHRRRDDEIQLTLAAHHAILDGWSAATLLMELMTEYLGMIGAAAPATLEPPRARFVEGVSAERAALADETMLRFWRARLESAAPAPLPAFAREANAAEAGIRTHQTSLDADIVSALDALAQRERVPFRSTLLAAHAYVVSLLSSQTDIVTGFVVNTRPESADGERVLGLFLNTVPLRIDVRGAHWRELLAQVFDAERALLPYRMFPMAEIQRALGGAPLFHTAFNYTHFHAYDALARTDGLEVLGAREWGDNEFALAASFSREATTGAVRLSLDCAKPVPPDELERVSAWYTRTLEAIASRPDESCGRFSPLADRERALLERRGRAARVPSKAPLTHERISAYASSQPDAVAVVLDDRHLTYADLDCRSTKLADTLRVHGVGPETCVALRGPASPELVVAMLAVWKAGGAFVPLDPASPADRLDFILDDVAPVMVVDPRSGSIESRSRAAAHKHTSLEPGQIHSPDFLAYVIYTSGSTGTPKGVMATHRGLRNLLDALIPRFGLTPDSRVLQFAAIGFDAAISEIFTTLGAGARLVLASRDDMRVPARVHQLLRQHAITTAALPPALLAALPADDLPSLTTVVSVGDVCHEDIVRRWSINRRLLNGYGPTETTVCTTMTDTLDASELRPPIGQPIENLDVWVLNPFLGLAPVGVVGELWVGGDSVARGYLRRPDLTAERFVPHPWSESPGARLYRTGDLVRWRDDGQLEFLGRRDYQVKVRGVRIELGEIEAALLAHPGVREAVVLARTDTGDVRLVAYVGPATATDGAALLTADDLRAHLAKTLPDALVPTAYVVLPALPLTLNGKIDRAALPTPDSTRTTVAVAPRDALEEIVAGVWGTVLQQPSVGSEDNFFALGGHSLLAMQATTRLQDALGVPVPPRWLFDEPTVAGLAARLRTGEASSVAVPANPLAAGTADITPELLPLVALTPAEIDAVVATVDGGAANIQDVYPLTPLQEGMLFHHQLQAEGDAYLSHTLLAFDDNERCKAFIAALNAVVARHDILRTTVAWDRLGTPVQVVWREVHVPVATASVDPATGSVAAQLLVAWRHTRLDLTQAPLLRLVRAEDGGRRYLLLLYHHLVMDHTTLEVVQEEIAALLAGEAQRLPVPVPFRTFVAQTRSAAAAANYESFFRDMLGSVSTPTAPFGLVDVQGDGTAIREARATLSVELARRLREQARGAAATPAALCHLAWALVLARCSEESDVVFGTVLLGRLDAGADRHRAVGLFMNTLPFRVTCDERPVLAAVQDTQRRLFALLRHEHASLALAQRCSSVPAPSPLFSALLNYRHSSGSARNVALDGVTGVESQERNNYPLSLAVDDEGVGFALTAQVASTAVDPARVCALMECALEAIVAALAEAPQTPLCQLDLLPAVERRQLLIDWNATAAWVPDAPVHELVEAQAALVPEATAVICGDEAVSYATLDARANELADSLIAAGVGPDVRVAVAIERSPALIIALLATWKAGGAYVPLDPAYPTARLAFMLEDSGAQVLLTEESVRARLPRTPLCTLSVEAVLAGDNRPPTERLPRAVSPDSLAYVLYTSGSSGRPKGVQITHRALGAFLTAMRRAPGLEPTDRLLAVTTLSFDIAALELWLPLTTGATVILAAGTDIRDGRQLAAVITRQRPTLMQATPALWRLLLEAGWRNEKGLRVLVGGDALPADLARALVELAPAVWNLYGPTETTIWSTAHRVREVGASVPIGRPIANTRCYVLDEQGQPTPIGAAGELFVGGHGVARGYLGRPDLTAERFVPDPFSGEIGARLYSTGDRVRYRADGELEFLGRRDHQVKVRGVRIELGEIETALLSHPAVRQAVVLARNDAGNARLVAYVVIDSATHGVVLPDSVDLRTHLASMLPEAIIPTAYVVLTTLPLTPNGKIDRAALPTPAVAHTREPLAPRDALEEVVAGVWATVLQQPRISVDDDFFVLGGHSLVAMQVSARLHDTLGVPVPVRWLFEAPTVAALTERLGACVVRDTEAGAAAREAAARAIAPVPRAQPLPLSFAQERLWFLDQLLGTSPAYNMPGAIVLTGRLDVAALAGALSALVARHEPLRTRLVAEAGVPAQVIATPAPVDLPVLDLRDETDRAAAVADRIRVEAGAPFDLARDLPLRVQLLREADDRWTLLLTAHHTAADGWSVSILVRELSVLYAAHLAGEPARLPALTVQYADFAVWQRGWLAGDRLNRLVAYWRTQLAGVPDSLELPTDRPRRAQPTQRGATVELDIDAPLTAALQALTRSAGATLFMTLLTAWATLVSRWSGQSDLVIGSPVANRATPAVEPLIGCFVNTLALRVASMGRPSFRTLLARVRQTCLEAYAHQDLPFETLVEALALPRTRVREPLVQVLFVLQNTPGATLDLPGLSFALAPQESPGSKFDLTLTITERDNGLQAALEYATDLFDRSTIERLAGQFVEVLRTAVALPDVPLADRDLLPASERQQLLVDWNATTASVPDATVHQLIEAQVVRTPDAPAVIIKNESLSYATLNARANQLAHALIAAGVGPDVRVAIALDRSPSLIIALLATWKAGGAYVPLDPAHPSARLAFLLADADARILLTETSVRARLPQPRIRTWCLDAEAPDLATRPTHNPTQPTDPAQLAYVIYTSGSTGSPKGVAMPHAPLVNLVRWQRSATPHGPARTLQYASVGFDVSVQEITATLASGGRLVPIGEEARRDGDALLHVLVDQAPEQLFLPYAVLAAVCDTARHTGRSLGAVRAVFTAGEQLKITPAIAQQFEGCGARLYNQYGPTETHVVTAFALDAEAAQWPELPPIGRPIANTRCYVLDAEGQPTPIGVPGELFIGGVSLARGYLGRPDLTAERFIPDPISGELGARLYATGDRVRYRADGELEFLGRRDHQVKVRGVRVELGEIEAALLAHPAIRETVVLARMESGDARLVAYVVLAPATDSGLPATTADLRAHLAATLPDALVPTAYVVLPALPLTPNGKVDRTALPAPEAARASEAMAPRDALEEIVAGVWATVLRQPAVSVDDDFFALGGHSLRAMQVTARLHDALGVPVPVRWIFDAPTVAALASRLRPAVLGDCSPATAARLIPRTRRDEPLPLSFAQQRLWFLDQLIEASPAYNIPAAVRFEGAFDADAIERAINIVAARHGSLRTNLTLADGEPVQRVAAVRPLTLRRVNLSGEPAPLDAAYRAIAQETLVPFDLSTDPLLRVVAYRLGARDHVVQLTIHHAISDGWSMSVLVEETRQAYAALARGEAPALPPLAIQYGDYAAWQREWLQGDVRERLTAYWQQKLAGTPAVVSLRSDRPRPSHQTFTGGSVRVSIPQEDAAALVALVRAEGATVFMGLLAVFKALLFRYTGLTDVVVGSPIANRPRPELEALIGVFVNTLVLRTTVAPAESFRQLLHRVRETALEAYAHQDLPFELVVDALKPERSVSHSPLVQVLFALQNVPSMAMSINDALLSPLAIDSATAKFDLSLLLSETPSGLEGGVEFNTDLFDRTTIEQFAAHYAALVRAATARPDSPVSQLAFISDEERRSLAAWNDTEVPLALPDTLFELIEARANGAPEQRAVRFEREVLTYGELNRRANQLAHFLRRRGVTAESVVGICLERSLDLIVAIVGVLKAGGAYLPLDPGSPVERAQYMLETASAATVLTSRALAGATGLDDSRIVCLDEVRSRLAIEPAYNPRSVATGANAAYVIFTSGSTGRPKGAVNTHRAIVNRVRWAVQEFRIGADDRLLQKTPVTFDVSAGEILMALTSGACLVLARPGGHRDPAYLTDVIDGERITIVHFVPSMLRAFLDEPRASRSPSLRLVLCSGEALPGDLQALFFQQFDCALINLYGPTEAAIEVGAWRCRRDDGARPVPIGAPIANAAIRIVDEGFEPVPLGVPGELLIGGLPVARGYVGRSDLTAERFVPDPDGPPGARLYRTGDRARWRADGQVEFLGRLDFQIKIRGFRVEAGEIEAALTDIDGIAEGLVILVGDDPEETRLVAYARHEPGREIDVVAARAALARRLPEYMVPAQFMVLDEFPRLPNGKADRARLPPPSLERPHLRVAFEAPEDDLENVVSRVWCNVLKLERVGANDNFFEIGGHSLSAVRVFGKLRETLHKDLALVDLFAYPTVRALARHLSGDETTAVGTVAAPITATSPSSDIAVIGMAGRFPGAGNVDQFWRNLEAGIESILRFSDEEAIANGADRSLLGDPHYVKAGGVLDDVELFDAPFFGCSPREAEVMDPQHRVFLESAWEALEDAGYDSERDRRPVGVFAGTGVNTYLLSNLLSNGQAIAAIGEGQAAIANVGDYLATRVSYKLDLTGPSFTVQTACSTSLVAVHLACRALVNGECDMAIAGGVSIAVPQKRGYLYVDGGTRSPDGHCRAFDANAQGMVAGSGVGAVVLKRLADAVADGDRVLAVVKGTAINNDGASKVGYTAPSVDGQARAVHSALRAGGVDPFTIGYVEAHGTATAIGDPIEVEALARVFRGAPEGSVGLGSVKTNIGHLDAAAGIAGLIKSVLALHHRRIPPSLHFERPNPQIDFSTTPFFVVDRLRDWTAPSSAPRRAGVSSFGIGGTNAHVVLEEAPPVEAVSAVDEAQLYVLSAHTPAALNEMRSRLAAHLEAHADLPQRDIAWTLQVGRRAFPLRTAVVARSRRDAIERILAASAPTRQTTEAKPRYAFLFPGQGSQYPRMAHALAVKYATFRGALVRCAAAMASTLDVDLLDLLNDDSDGVATLLQQTQYAQPALFAVEYALASMLMEVGIKPAALLGHSLGEYVAACLAGVFTVEDAASLVAARGRLMSEAPPGVMLAARLREADAQALVNADIALAAINGPNACVIAGTSEAINRIERRFEASGVACTRLRTSHAFHSHLMEGVADRFRDAVAARPRTAPTMAWVSNVTGRWIDPADAIDPTYWARQLCATVRFADCLQTLSSTATRLLEVGPGSTLAALARQTAADVQVIATLPAAEVAAAADEFLLAALAHVWTEGAALDWPRLHAGQKPRRVALPTYPFERTRHWIEPGAGSPQYEPTRVAEQVQIYVPSWRRSAPVRVAAAFSIRRRWLVLADRDGLGEAIARRLEAREQIVTVVHDASIPDGLSLDVIVDCIADFRSLIALGQQLERRAAGAPVRLEVVSTNLHDVLGIEPIDPAAAMALGPLLVIPQENPNVRTRNIDVARTKTDDAEPLADAIVAELATEIGDHIVALRLNQRWTPRYDPAPQPRGDASAVADNGAFVVFGGLGQVGRVAARALVSAGCTRLVLVGRRAQEREADVIDLEHAGADVVVMSGDIEDRASIQSVFARTRERFGRVGGVVHAAGLRGPALVCPLAEMDEAHIDAQFGTKVRGLTALAAAIDEERPALVLLTASLAATLGGLGFGAYAAANAFMDAFATSRARSGSTRWVAVDWDAWRVDADSPDVADVIDGMRGHEAFRSLIQRDLGPRVLAVASDFEARLARWINPGVPAGRPAHEGTRQRAANDVEQVVVDVWRDLLGHEDIGADDNFFERGGDSLLATQLVSRVRRALAVEVPLRLIFERPTVRAMAAALGADGPAPADGAVAIARRTPQSESPLSSQQKRLWFLARLDPSNSSYTIPGAVRVSGPLHLDLLQRAFDGLVSRHEALRTVFVERGGVPTAIVAKAGPVHIEIEEIDGDEAFVLRRATAIVDRPFDLARGPLLRVGVLRRSPADHLIVLAIHHIVSDAWSMSMLIREFVELYGATAAGRQPSLADVTLQYADYAAWQAEWQGGEDAQRQLAFWTRTLAALPQLDLSTDRPRGAALTYRGSAISRTLGAPAAEALRRFGRESGATSFMTLVGAFAAFLHRYTRQDDLAIGTPSAGRTRTEFEGIVGLFVNALVLRVDASAAPSFRLLVERVRHACLEAWANQEVPFEDVVDALQPRRTPSQNPLFQVMFVLQNVPQACLAMPGLTFDPVTVETTSAKFDLTVYVVEDEHDVRISLEYNRDLFDEARAERMLDHYSRLLVAALAEPDRPIASLPMLSGKESARIVEWNRTRADYPRDRCVHELFREQAARHPAAIAALIGDDAVTYGELDTRSNQLAHRLLAMGCGHGVVGLAVERSLEMLVSVVGILKAGAAYLPIDRSHPREPVARLLSDADACTVVTDETYAASISATLPVLTIDRSWHNIASEPRTPPHVVVRPDDLAYVSFTSGSTGAPKGVAVPHRAIVRLVRGQTFVSLTTDEVVLQFAPLAFDASTFEIWGALLNGARLAFVPPGTPSLAELARFLAGARVTTAWLTAGLFHQMVEREIDALAGLRQLVAGGDVLSIEHVRALQAGAPRLRLVNGYGPTEGTTFACCHVVTADGSSERSVPIGRPLANTSAYVLDERLEPLPPGVPGELFLGGEGVARGYVGRADLTAERFLPDPFAADGTRMYRTGDLARWLDDGTLEFVGRGDRQVKIRGFRVEPAELEETLAAHPNVREAAVVARTDTAGDKRLIAYVTSTDSNDDGGALKAFLQARLPEYLVPSAVVRLDAMPLTANGKIDRAALPDPDRDRPDGGFLPPRTPEETTVARIWSEVLSLPTVGVYEDFFELGGHSLRATQVVARLRDEMGVEVPLRTLFTARTVEGLAAEVDRLRIVAAEARPPRAIRPVPRSTVRSRRAMLEELPDRD
jgi:amino acid adenylation domain-containing protein